MSEVNGICVLNGSDGKRKAAKPAFLHNAFKVFYIFVLGYSQ